MDKLTQRGPNATTPARLPGIQTARIADPNVRQAVESLREWVEVRLGSRGDIWERAITKREYKNDLDDLQLRIKQLETKLLDAIKDMSSTTSSSAPSATQADLDSFKAYVQAELDALRTKASSGVVTSADVVAVIRQMVGTVFSVASVAGVLAATGRMAGSSAGTASLSAGSVTNFPGAGASAGVASVAGVGPVAVDPHWANVVLLLDMEGGSVVDRSLNNYSISVTGGGSLSSAQAAGGAQSYLSTVSANMLNTGAVISGGTNLDWTIEARVWASGTANSPHVWQFSNSSSDRCGLYLYLGQLGYYTTEGNSTLDPATIPTNQWVSVALVAEHTGGGKYTTSLYVNGTRKAQTFNNGFPVNGDSNCIFSVANPYYFNSGSNAWNGYIDEVRVTRGVARYTGATASIDSVPYGLAGGSTMTGSANGTASALAPQTAPNTELLVRFDGGNGSTTFTDYSSNGHALTAAGGMSQSTANTNFVGSTGLFSSGRYLHTPDSSTFDMGAGAFTVEALVDLDYDAEHCIISKTSTSFGLQYEWAIRVALGSICMYYGIRGTNQSQIVLYFPVWMNPGTRNHVAMVRNASGEWRCFLNGVVGTQYQVSPLASSLSFGPVTTGVYTNAVDFGNTTNRLAIGYAEAGFWQFNGDMQYLRFTRSALYTGNFTPPTKL